MKTGDIFTHKGVKYIVTKVRAGGAYDRVRYTPPKVEVEPPKVETKAKVKTPKVEPPKVETDGGAGGGNDLG
jgi:hypothetical protein